MPAIIAAVITVVLLVIIAVLLLFFQMIALNGATTRQGVTAMSVAAVCQGIGILLSAFLAARITGLVTAKLGWNNIIAVVIAVGGATFLGSLIAIVSAFIGIPIAGVR